MIPAINILQMEAQIKANTSLRVEQNENALSYKIPRRKDELYESDILWFTNLYQCN